MINYEPERLKDLTTSVTAVDHETLYSMYVAIDINYIVEKYLIVIFANVVSAEC